MYTAASSLSLVESSRFAASVSRNARYSFARPELAIVAAPPFAWTRALMMGQYSRCSKTSASSGSISKSEHLNAGPIICASFFRFSRRDSASLTRAASKVSFHLSPASHRSWQYTPRRSRTSSAFFANSPSTKRHPIISRSTPSRFFVFRYASTSSFVAFCET